LPATLQTSPIFPSARPRPPRFSFLAGRSLVSAAFYIAYGDYGARRPKSSSYETWVVAQGIVAGLLATGIIWNFFRYIGTRRLSHTLLSFCLETGLLT
jgi:hypothetical protein